MKLDQFTYRQKNLMLMLSTVLMLVLIYLFAIKNTIELAQENGQLTEQLQQVSTLQEDINKYKQLQSELERKFGQSAFNDKENHELLLGQVSDFCKNNQLLIRDYPASSLEETEDYLVETNTVVVEGNYTDLLKLTYAIEQQFKLGRIASAKFEAKKDRKTRKLRLTARVLVQNIKPKDHEA